MIFWFSPGKFVARFPPQIIDALQVYIHLVPSFGVGYGVGLFIPDYPLFHLGGLNFSR